jgi:hypothetical protein
VAPLARSNAGVTSTDADQHHQHDFIGADALTEDQPFENHGERRETRKTQRRNRYTGDLHRDEKTHPVPGQQHAAERQAPPVERLQFLPAVLAGEAGEKGQGEHGKRGTSEDDHRRRGGREFAEYAGEAEHQSADMQGAEGGTRSHCNPYPNTVSNVGAAAGCDLLILIFQSKIKRSQPAAAPTRGCTLKRVAARKSVGQLAFFVAGIAAQLAG